MLGIFVLSSCLSVNSKLVLAFQQKSSFYDSSPTHFNRAVCHGSQAHVNFIKLTSRPGQLTVLALNFIAWVFFTGYVPQEVIKEMPNRTLANHFGLRLIHVYVKRRALSNNSLLRNSVGHLSASGQLPFHHAERIPQGAFTDERLQRMPVSQAAPLNARLAELGICCPLYTTQIKVHQKSTLSFMSLTFMSHLLIIFAHFVEDVERSN